MDGHQEKIVQERVTWGHDDYGYWFIILEDKLREGEEPDELYFQQYNYVDDYDKGDSGVSIEEIFQKANDEYWEPGEDEYIKNRFKVPAKLYEQWFGPNGPETEEELDAIPLPDAETRYKAWIRTPTITKSTQHYSHQLSIR